MILLDEKTYVVLIIKIDLRSFVVKNKIYHYIVFIITFISCNLYSESIEDYVALEFGNYIPIESVVPFSDLIEYLERN